MRATFSRVEIPSLYLPSGVNVIAQAPSPKPLYIYKGFGLGGLGGGTMDRSSRSRVGKVACRV